MPIYLVILLGEMGRADECVPGPFGTGGFWVSSYFSNEILRFEQDGAYLGTFSDPALSGPRGITVSPSGDVYISSQNGDEILVFDESGTYLRSFSDPGLDGPTGSVVGPEGDFFVASFGTDEILRFDGTETLVETYTSPGLNGPNCILFRADGEFWVTGQLSNDVHRFDAEGNAIGSFPATGVLSVMGAAFDLGGRLLVGGGANASVSLFDCDGAYLETWDVAGGPQSIAVREDGTIFITTYYSDEVLQYSPTGNLLASWTGGNTLRGIEFFPAPVPAFLRGGGNGVGILALRDAIAILTGIFVDASGMSCADAFDVNDDGALGLLDALGVLSYLFQSGVAPAAPFPDAGSDPTSDSLGCLD